MSKTDLEGEQRARKETENYAKDANRAIRHYREEIHEMEQELKEARKGIRVHINVIIISVI